MKKIVLAACVIASTSLLSACEVIFPSDHHHDRDRYDRRYNHDDHSHHRDRDRDDDRRYRDDDDDNDDRGGRDGNFCPPGQAKKGRC